MNDFPLMKAPRIAIRALKHSVLMLAMALGAAHASGKQPDSTDSGNAIQPMPTAVFDYSAIEKTGQIPLCMIGDSITWAEQGDWWRKKLIHRLPSLAFVGTHSAMFGYSHAGEGGNGTGDVLARLNDIPACPYYHVLIGTNNNNVKKAEAIPERANQTAQDVLRIVEELLKKPHVKTIFLGSLLPCATENPLRDQCNSATNVILRRKLKTAFPDGKVIWIEYEAPIRAIEGWEKKIFLHPNEDGYAIISDITAKAIRDVVDAPSEMDLERVESTGVQVVNLMTSNNTTTVPIIAGWYTLSCQIDEITGDRPEIILESRTARLGRFEEIIPVAAPVGTRISAHVFTNYEGHGYSRDHLSLKTRHCRVSNILLEKMRPSKQSSAYDGRPFYVDTVSPVSAGELLEYSKGEQQ